MEKDVDCFCLSCEKENRHDILWKCGSPLDGSYPFRHFIASCRSCGAYTYAQNSFDYFIYGDWSDVIEVFQFGFEDRISCKNFSFLPENVKAIHAETIKAIALDLSILAGISLRSVVEAFCKERKARGKMLIEKIDSLIKEGVLTKSQAKPLQDLRSIIGNKAAHEMCAHTKEQLIAALNIVNNVLKIVYETPLEHDKMVKTPHINSSL